MSDDLLIVFEPKDVRATFACDDPAATFGPILAPIRKAMDEFIPNASVQTKRDRDAIKKFAAQIVKSKTLLESHGKAVADAIKLEPKLVDASRRYVKDTLDAWRDEVRAPYDEWEARENERIQKHENALAQLKELALPNFRDGRPLPARELRINLEAVKAYPETEDACEEYLDGYRNGKAAAIEALTTAMAIREAAEAQEAELAALRAEKEERDRRDAEEAARKAQAEREAKIAEESAERAKQDAIREAQERANKEVQEKIKAANKHADYCRAFIQSIIDCGNGLIGGSFYPFPILFRELEEKIIVTPELGEFEAEAHRAKAEALEKLKKAFAEQQRRAEQEENERVEREARIAQEAEVRAKEEVEAQKRREEDDRRRREADTEHKRAVNTAAVQAFVDRGLSEESARQVVIWIAKGEIPAIAIAY